MGDKDDERRARVIHGGLRHEFRKEQIEAIKIAVRSAYADRIRAATSKNERRVLEAERNAEIARRIEPLIRDRDLDTPECL